MLKLVGGDLPATFHVATKMLLIGKKRSTHEKLNTQKIKKDNIFFKIKEPTYL
jgi:hypothetical protein